MDINTLRDVIRGEILKAEYVNTIKNAVQRLLQPPITRNNEFGNYIPNSRRQINVYAPFTIPAYSLFGIAGGSTSSGGTSAGGTGETVLVHPQVVVAGIIGAASNPGSPLLPLTNGQIEIAASTNGTCYPVDYFDTCELTVNAAAIPAIGNACGPDLDSFDVSANSTGFICLSSASGGTAGGRVNVMRTREPIAMLCSSVGTIAMGATGNGVPYLGGGLAVDPKTGSGNWQLQITNPQARQIQQGEKVYVADLLGFGLCALPVTTWAYAVVTTEITAAASGKMTLFKQNANGTLTTTGIENVSVYCPNCPSLKQIGISMPIAAFINPESGLWNALVVFDCLEDIPV